MLVRIQSRSIQTSMIMGFIKKKKNYLFIPAMNRYYETEVVDFINAVEMGSVDGVCKCMLRNCKVCSDYKLVSTDDYTKKRLNMLSTSPKHLFENFCDIKEKEDYLCKYCKRTINKNKCGLFCCK